MNLQDDIHNNPLNEDEENNDIDNTEAYSCKNEFIISIINNILNYLYFFSSIIVVAYWLKFKIL